MTSTVGIQAGSCSTDGSALEHPAFVVDLDLAQPVVAISSTRPDGRCYRAVWLVVRVFEEPVGLVAVDFTDGTASVAAQCRAIEADCGAVVRERASAAGVSAAPMLSGLGLSETVEPAFLAEHNRWRADGPEIAVVICTRNRPTDIARALDSLGAQSYSRYRVLVVDNAPPDSRTADVVRSRSALDERISYTMEPRPGLSWARNHALTLIDEPVVAWLDDDEVADKHWLMEIAAAFCMTPDAAAVSGSVVPAELETQAQLWFEQYGGHTKGRGFTGAIFDGRAMVGQSPLYPLPAFGAGANMAFPTQTLKDLGGFDTALGAGTKTLGGEDTLVFSQILLGGGTVVYRPSALTRHFHRPDYAALARQMTGYGIGLTAYYSSLVRYDWKLMLPLARLVPTAFRDTFRPDGDRLASVPASFPRELLSLKNRGMIKGPIAYFQARRVARRLSKGTG
jgi:glycosyltransferase involved in cell wall biosynthesis